ncbi:MAG: geranylgeranylglyceryl/heptaprenylglyceryl phosphate synthase [Flavobacterium sp.]|nr:MAG: geranylgeranylglyceryl/heptaprenylglyceryl phosphate synthase [Flavobacterium sp.]
MNSIYEEILNAKSQGRRLLAILIDPEKTPPRQAETLSNKIAAAGASHIFIGGSTAAVNFDEVVKAFQRFSKLPIVLFPGSSDQLSNHAHAILFLSLLSGRNPEYLISQHVKAAPLLKNTNLEIVPTAYILIESGTQTAVERVSRTSPMPTKYPQKIVDTALAGEMMGNRLIYLEAGSGAKNPVPPEVIQKVASEISVPLIVGGGIRSKSAIDAAFAAGADMVVIGTAFEENTEFFEE